MNLTVLGILACFVHADASFAEFLPHANNFLETVLPPESAVERGNFLLSTLFTDVPNREAIFAGPIRVEHLFLADKEVFYYNYGTTIMRILTLISDYASNRPGGVSWEIITKLMLLNIMHKMMLRHSELVGRPIHLIELEALRNTRSIFSYCALNALRGQDEADPELISNVAAFRDVSVWASSIIQNIDEESRRLPEAVNNLLEYFIIVDRALKKRHSPDVSELLALIRSRIHSNLPGDAIHRVSRILRSNVEARPNSLHTQLIEQAKAML